VTEMRFDHVTAIVDDADAAAAALERVLGAKPLGAVSLPGMAIRSFRLGEGEIHLNAPTGPGPVEEHHRRHGPGYHHIALRVGDLDATLRDLAARGLHALGAPIETAPGLREVFLDPAGTGGLMLQLVERRDVLAEAYELDGDAVAALAAQAPGGRDGRSP
jgi:catechol 2,3-dioxygenase-like lactoylglutathione lyase family enzyme